jgi:hypothetical protein
MLCCAGFGEEAYIIVNRSVQPSGNGNGTIGVNGEMSTKRPPFDRDKFKRLIHFVIYRTQSLEGFGATKLYKVLWFSEAKIFALTGRPITGAVYIREEHGPVPKFGKEIREELQAEGLTREWKEPFYKRTITRFYASRGPNMAGFTTEELQTISYWIKHIHEEHTAETISDLSHDTAWEIAAMKEELPLHAYFVERIKKPTEEELERARHFARDKKLP